LFMYSEGDVTSVLVFFVVLVTVVGGRGDLEAS
jgi:hypothetical protein